uniref:BTB/POZ domain contaning protein n=1 Tax=Clandestinovirus TaxID=2831644 RepID=A0A8F8KNG0_9VIRU|nr:BTB/POZ domain contaning protein [Clandestinovirus]
MQGITAKLTVNVGGTTFTTTPSTIERIPYFAARLKNTPNKDAELFVDRSSTLFHYILDHARGNRCSFPASFEGRVTLIDECDFYGLESLIDEIELSFTKEELHKYNWLDKRTFIDPQDFERQVLDLWEAKKALGILFDKLTSHPLLTANAPNEHANVFQTRMDKYFDEQFKFVDPTFDVKALNALRQSSIQLLNGTCNDLQAFITWLSECFNSISDAFNVHPLARFCISVQFVVLFAKMENLRSVSNYIPSSSVRVAMRLLAPHVISAWPESFPL